MGLGFNLLDQMTFYGSYHNNKWNQLVHVIFVPMISWTALVFAAATGPLVPLSLASLGLPAFITKNFIINLGFFLFAFYALYYLSLGDLFAAATFDVILLGLFLSANAFYAAYGSQAWKYALALHVLSWWAQVHLGHGILEGRKPALLDSLFQSFVLAPLFVWFEVLFTLGYNKQFRATLQASVDKKIAADNAKIAAKNAAKAK